MLVCSVSLRPRRTAIAAGITEVAAALDAPGTGNVVFATLVDDPASVGDLVDAYLGEIMLEAASANDIVEAGLTYVAAIDEVAVAADALDATMPGIYAGAIAEAATAADVFDASIAAATAVTTMSTTLVGPLLAFDTTFPSASLTVINVGQL